MKSFSINSNSLFYRFCNYFFDSHCYDLCTLMRRFVGALFFTILILFIVVVPYVWLTGFLLFNVAMNHGAVILLAVHVLVALLFAVSYFHERYKDHQREKLNKLIEDGIYVEEKPSVFKTWYNSFKEKTCVRLNVRN